VSDSDGVQSVRYIVDADGEGPACRHVDVYDADADADQFFVIEITAVCNLVTVETSCYYSCLSPS
jgi:hypothetical protein